MVYRQRPFRISVVLVFPDKICKLVKVVMFYHRHTVRRLWKQTRATVCQRIISLKVAAVMSYNIDDALSVAVTIWCVNTSIVLAY